MDNNINIHIKVQKDGVMPTYGSENAAGCDLYATEDMVVRPGEKKIMPLNFIMAMPPEIEAQIRPRSGLSLKTSLRLPNSVGTIDSDYRNIVGVIIENIYNISNLPYEIAINPKLLTEIQENYIEISLNDYLKSEGYSLNNELSISDEKILLDKQSNPYGTIYIKKGERIAQMIFSEYKRANFMLDENTEFIGENRGGGFGHTGK